MNSDRKQYTSISGFNSDLTNIHGVLKGLVSDRHLFLTYISGLLQGIKYSKVHHFADDAILNFSSSINLINKQVSDNFKVINGSENLVTVRSSSFELHNA